MKPTKKPSYEELEKRIGRAITLCAILLILAFIWTGYYSARVVNTEKDLVQCQADLGNRTITEIEIPAFEQNGKYFCPYIAVDSLMHWKNCEVIK